MNKLKHTPGPWKTEEHEDGFLEIVTDYKSGLQDTIICQGIYKSGGICDNNNARLIAAAPEMLEALLSNRDTLLKLKKYPMTETLCMLIDSEIDLINDLLEKATGMKIEEILEDSDE